MREEIDLTGYVSENATIKQINGKNVVSFSISLTTGKKSADGKNEYRYYQVMSYNEKMLQYITKGRLVQVSGKYSDNIYTDKNGVSRIGRTCWANSLDFIPTGSSQNNQPQQQGLAYQPQTPSYQHQAPQAYQPQQQAEPFFTPEKDLPF